MRKTKMVLKLATYKKLFFVGLFSFFFQQKALSQTYGMDLVTNQKSQCQPALFKWVVQKAPSGSVFLWDYGSGIYQGSDTFYALIKPSGKISVKVAVKMPSGKNAILSKIDFVEVYAKPEPKLYASRKILCDGPDSATYFDITPNGAKRSWVIDGTNYNNASKKQTHYYASTGVKKLSMVVEDANGCRTIKEYDSIAIIHKDVIIDFAADKLTGCVPQTIKFTPTINNNGLKILSYQWLFNGGQPFKQLKEVPDSVKYSAAGKFSVSLEVKAENGCVHKFEKQDYLAFGSIDSISLKISDTSVCVGKTITIENLNKNLAGNFKWTLKGTTSIAQPDKYTCNARYDTLGKFDIEVTYTYNGCEVSKILKKIIRVKGVAAEFSSKDYYHCQMPHSVHLENLSKSFESGKMYYKWMVFDNSKLVFISAKLNDSFQVKKTGEYDVMLVTTHSNGCVDTFTQKKYIRNTPIKPNFEALFTVGCIGQKIEFLQKTPRSSYLSPDRFVWTFYDKDTTKILDTSTFTGPQFKYSDTGFYNVKMVAYNTIGCKDSIVKRNYIEIVNPRINFELAKPVICKKEVLIAKGRSYPRHVKFNYSWRFKNNIDNSIIYSSDSVYKDTIRKSGEYTLKFFHTINAGCKDSIIKNDLIKVNGISGTMSLDTFNGCSPLVVSPYLKLTENYHFGSGDSSINYKWNTISSNNFVIKNSTSPNPVFIFNDQGNYSINLLANNSVGCPFEAVSKIIHVGVFSDFDISDNVVCANQELTLTNRSFNHTAIKWLLNSNTITTNNLYDDKISVYFNKSGDQRIGLVAIKSNYCFDTIFKMVRSIIVKAELISPEPYLKCAPVYAQFISKSQNADSLKWDFGNGNFVITKDTLVANIYNKNSGSLKGYDITLIAKSNEGCSDTIVKSGYIKVVGPIPSFELYNFTGCEPLNVQFKNTSTDVFKHFLNLSDGSPLDSAFG
ncbi:MAG: PKD domain-containing protein, partial [Bacteroidia bacterium]